jgi:hypothetical protein
VKPALYGYRGKAVTQLPEKIDEAEIGPTAGGASRKGGLVPYLRLENAKSSDAFCVAALCVADSL